MANDNCLEADVVSSNIGKTLEPDRRQLFAVLWLWLCDMWLAAGVTTFL